MSVPRRNALRAPGPALTAALAGAAVALAVFPPGLNPFGPVKLLVTMVCAAFASSGLALDSRSRARLANSARSPVGAAVTFLCVVSIASFAFSSDVRLALVGAYPGYVGLAAACAWIAFSLAAAASSVADARRLVGRGMTVALCVAGAYAVLQRLGLDPLPASAAFDSGRSASVLGNAANLGAYVALALPLVGDRVLGDESKRWRTIAWFGVVLGASSGGFSGSRGAWLGVVFGLCTWFAFSFAFDRADGRRVAGLVVVLAAVLALSIVLTPVAAERATGGGTASSTVLGRLAVWRSTVPMIAERPLLGRGPAGYGRAHTAYASPEEIDPRGRMEALEDPHNLVLSAGANYGIPGILGLAAIAGLAIQEVWRARRGPNAAWAASLGAASVGIATALQFHFVTLDTGAGMAVTLGCIAGLSAADGPEAPARRNAGWIAATVVFAALALAAAGGVAGDAFVRTGFAAADKGEWSRARVSFDRARSLAPWAPEYAWAEGRAATDAITSGAPVALTDGIEAFRRAEANMPGDSRVPRDLGDMLVAGAVTGGPPSLWVDALAAYERSLAFAPIDPRALLGKGVAEAGAGDLSSAVRDITRATDLAPGFADAWENLAAVYDAQGDAASAAEARARAGTARE